MPAGQKEPESAATFSVDDYKDTLLEQGYSDESAKMLAEKKKEKLAEAATKPPAVAKMIEIDLNDINVFGKTQREKMVTVRRGGKTFQRKQKVGKKDDKSKQKQLAIGFPAIMSESNKFKSRREFMAAVKDAWTTGKMIDIHDERGVAFGGMLLTADILEQIKSDHPRSKLLTYNK